MVSLFLLPLVVLLALLVVVGAYLVWRPVLSLQGMASRGLLERVPGDESAGSEPKKAPEAGGDETALVSQEDVVTALVARTRRRTSLVGYVAGFLLLLGPAPLVPVRFFTSPGGLGPSYQQQLAAVFLAGCWFLVFCLAPFVLHGRWVLGRVPPALRDH